MKKLITFSAIIALSFATLAEAKGGRSMGGRSFSVTGKPLATKKAPATKMNHQQKDATFANTPAQTQSAPVSANNGNRLASFATGAAAGYLLSDMLTPNAQASQTTTTTQTANEANTSATPAVASAQNNAKMAEFKSIGGQIDPYLVEKTDGYRRYCIAGVQYLASMQGSQSAPIVMVNPNGSPLQCNLLP
ncbi:hypothetical protein [[Haemophilus] ducreyi]|uniref:hypothetical protein n=1 Tax=Haemophilus ducreyi TaxID=730 RepID=UPI000655652B|nr:hypothetical protein [[Haemophilus] ducreyi]AKO45609.1 hypothetical protein RZ66_05090 [[Haemophilus] ducreyi]AKO46995.1 hypothetical protein RZ67_05000 [[Haemophilus] ducreyi]AKO48339.1 hypothetical protein RZ68_04985 [[Haemophilus] ducreyi]AKO49727.1 hypothetical protein RZ69_05025 [[Haemophilus] ducreyi]ANF67478.1 hypothetical protein A6041_02305 [[Haemophilus] ducreyi]